MKKIILFVLLSFLFSNFYASDLIEIRIGNIISKSKKERFVNFFGKVEKEFVALKLIEDKNTSYYIEYFDENLTPTQSVLLNMPDKKDKIFKMFIINEQFYCFYENYDNKNKLKKLYGANVDMNGNFGKSFLISEFKGKYWDYGHYDINYVNSISKFVINNKARKSFVNNFDVLIVGKDLKIETVKLTPKKINNEFIINTVVIDDKGNCYYYVSTKKTNKKFIISFYIETEKIYEYEINNRDQQLGALNLSLDSNYNLIVTAMSSNSDSKYSNGIYVMKINGQNKKLESEKNFITFDKDLLEKLTFINKDELKHEGLKSYYVKDPVIDRDGNIFFICEIVYMQTIKERESTYVSYSSYDIIMVKISSNLEVKWIETVPKSQFSEALAVISFVHFFDGENIHFLYNDFSKTIEKKSGHFPFIITLTNDGDVINKTQINNEFNSNKIKIIPYSTELKQLEFRIEFYRSEYVIGNTILFLNQKGQNYRLISVKH